jgi:hypothetical protein
MKDAQLPAAMYRLLRDQHGVFSRAQARRSGISSGTIDARVRHRTWLPVYPGVYRLATAQLTAKSLLWGALLYAGRGAVLSHWTAAYLAGLISDPAQVVHVTIPSDRRVRELPRTRIHRSASVLQAVMAHEDPPRTTMEATLLDLADTTDSLDRVCGWITDAISRELTTEARLLAAIDARAKLRWRAELRPLIAAAASGDHSLLEYRYDRDVERRHRLPPSQAQVLFRAADGSSGRRDRVYQEYGLIIELDGELGHTGAAVRADNARDRAATISGKQTMRYGWREVTETPCVVAVEVGQVLSARGWANAPLPCGIYCTVRRVFSA